MAGSSGRCGDTATPLPGGCQYWQSGDCADRDVTSKVFIVFRQSVLSWPASGRISPVDSPADHSGHRPSTSRSRQRTQRRDGIEDLLEQTACDHDLGHLERDRAPMLDDLRADLHQAIPQGGHRPARRMGETHHFRSMALTRSRLVTLRSDHTRATGMSFLPRIRTYRTKFPGRFPSSTAAIPSTASRPIASRASAVELPICGSSTALSSSR